ncbi:hypothetical protein AAZV13_18G182100 [Glycine max]
MDRVSHRGSRFLLDASPLLELEFQPTMDPVINWVSNFLHSLQHSLAAIPVVWLLWKVVFGVVWLLWKLISGVVLLLWNVISIFVLGLWNVIRKIFCCCCERGKTMKAPGRNIRIYRDDFERSPKNYFRNLRRDQRNWRNNQPHTILV